MGKTKNIATDKICDIIFFFCAGFNLPVNNSVGAAWLYEQPNGCDCILYISKLNTVGYPFMYEYDMDWSK